LDYVKAEMEVHVPMPAAVRLLAVRLLDQGFIFGLGAAIIPLISWSRDNTELPYEWQIAGPVLLVSVVAGLLEAVSIRQTGRRRWIGSWLPLALGAFAVMVVQHMQWHAQYGAGAPPDAAMAMGLAIAAFLFGVPIVGMLVNVVGALAARLLGPVPPAPASSWRQASRELLDALGRNAWLPLAHTAVAAVSAIVIVLGPLDVVPQTPQILSACAIAAGMLAIVAAVLSHDRSEARWWPANAGLIGVGAGILTLVWPLGMLVLIVLMSIWGIASGMFLVSGANRLRGALRNEQLVRLAGLASLTLGGVWLYLLFRLVI
jgi:uncharacterized membrane protein HdeD (DUF308 family)